MLKLSVIKSNNTEKTARIINACCNANKEYAYHNGNYSKFYEIDDSILFVGNCNSHTSCRFVERADYSSSSLLNKEYVVDTAMELLTYDDNAFWDMLDYDAIWLVNQHEFTYEAFCVDIKWHDCGNIVVNTAHIRTYLQKSNAEDLAVNKGEPVFAINKESGAISLNPSFRVEKTKTE